MKIIDNFLNKITMYKLTLYYLIFLIGVAIVLSFLKILNFNPLDIAINALAAVIVSYIFNYIFAKIFNAQTNVESVYITALILALIVPVGYPQNLILISIASIIAMGSKYILTIEKKHIFNPAAVAIAAISLLLPEHTATWWVGTQIMLPFVLIGGLLIIRKIQRIEMVINFLIVYLVTIFLSYVLRGQQFLTIVSLLRFNILDSALFFFALIMFTEPLTSPTTKHKRNYFAWFSAFLYATPALRLGFALTPELALVLGNVFSFVVNPTSRYILNLKQKIQLSQDTFEFVFSKPDGLKFTPGQYMEWTLPHKNIDSRGNRRYFSISSSPIEESLAMTVKFYDFSSSFKKELLNFQVSGRISAAQIAGDFVLPKDLNKPLVFVAGGVGIAPFRSMIRYIADKNLQTDIVLIFTNRSKEDIIYADIFEKAKSNGVRTIYNLTDTANIPEGWNGEVGYVTPEKIKQLIPDFKNRKYYLSGPLVMVQNFEKTLYQAGVVKNKIITDFFPGYSEK
jgi:glycine betaine catabolism B